MYQRINCLHWLIIIGLSFGFPGMAKPKSLYIISNTETWILRAYQISGTSLVYQTDYVCESDLFFGGGAVGIAIDESEYGNFLFVTFEGEQVIEIIDADTMRYIDTESTFSASNLAGIVADEGNSKIYTMDRYTNHLYSYSWIPSIRTLMPDFIEPYYIELQGISSDLYKGAFGIALDEVNDLLYVGDNTNKIKYYNTSDWSKAGEVNVTCNVIGVAVDVNRQSLYYGSMGTYGQGDTHLYKYNLSSGQEQSVTVGSSVGGIAVNKDTGYVYITTYGDGGSGTRDRLMIYDSNLVKQSWESNDIGNPAGICVPSGNVSYKPPWFDFVKDDNIPDGNCVLPGQEITYTLSYDANGYSDNNVAIVDYLPDEVNYISSEPNGNYNDNERTVTWNIGSVSPDSNGIFSIIVNVNELAEPCGVITNHCRIEGDALKNVYDINTPVCLWCPQIIYVDDSAESGSNTGMSWKNAYLELQSALDRAANGCGDEIWVAGGPYIPSVPQEYPTFQMVDGVSLYGHFAGDENDIYQRNLTNPASETILSGEGVSPWYLVTASDFNQNTTLDGFTITGYSTLVEIETAKLNIKNCLISGNGNEFGISADDSNFTVVDCIIKNISSNGIYSTNSNFTITDCNIHDNGIGINVQSSLAGSRITNNIIHNNISAGISVYAGESLLVANNWIHHNISDGIYTYPSITFRNNTIVSNGHYGIYDDGTTSGPTIHNCIIWNNAQDLKNTGSADWYHATYSCFTNYDIAIRGTGNIYGEANDPNFVSADSNNFHLDPNSPCIDKGDPNGNYDNQTDIDGECRVIYGKTALRVDIGADELYHSKVDYDHNNIVNFNDYAIWVNYWLTNDPNGCLDDDNDVDINDLAVFCDDWLWIAPWSPLYQSLGLGGMGMMAESSSESFVLSEEMPSETVMEEPSESNGQPMSAEQIQELIVWTERLWESNPELMEMAGQYGYDLIMESLKEQIVE